MCNLHLFHFSTRFLFYGLFLVFLWFISAGLYGCKGKVIAESETNFESNCWEIADTLELSFENSDTNQPVQLLTSVTFSEEDYPFRNIFLKMVVVSPSGMEDLVDYRYEVMDVAGNWFSNPSGGKVSFELPLAQTQRLREMGVYQFWVYQFMEGTTLCGVHKAGIFIKGE